MRPVKGIEDTFDVCLEVELKEARKKERAPGRTTNIFLSLVRRGRSHLLLRGNKIKIGLV